MVGPYLLCFELWFGGVGEMQNDTHGGRVIKC